MRKCKYRNCQKDISHKKSNALFCDRNCKSCERKYKKRQEMLIQNAILTEGQKVQEYKRLIKILQGEDNK